MVVTFFHINLLYELSYLFENTKINEKGAPFFLIKNSCKSLQLQLQLSTVDPVFVLFGATFVGADAALGEAQRRVQGDDAADVVADPLLTSDRKRRRVGKLFAVIRVVRHGHLLRPGVDEPGPKP